ncbi:MAG: alpha-galactosidase [Clostridia bacterium]|nr:alpha-galactosidase [Clostridia bacterium]
MPVRYNEETRTFHLTDGSRFSMVLRAAEDPAGGLTLYQDYWGAPVADGALAYLNHTGSRELASFDQALQLPLFAYPTSGRGDYRPAALRAVGADGTDCAILHYTGYEIVPGKPALKGLPAAYVEDEKEAETLIIRMQDDKTMLQVELLYTVMTDLHVLTQSVRLINGGDSLITLHDPASCCVSLRGEYDMLHLHGAWAKERSVERAAPMHGVREIVSCRGASGHQHNPFVAMTEKDTTEFHGNCWGLCLVYSGSHRMLAEQNDYGYTRIMGGVSQCAWRLEPGEEFQTPEMLMVYSGEGLNGMSDTFHRLIRTRVCRGVWRDKVRPVLVNNWEGTYFNFDTEKLLGIARKGAEIGAELFVLDDGWFGKRNNDDCSLGDWVVNEEKLPGGLKLLADKVNEMGLMFGLWFEPEMVSPDSDLYRAHPDWCLHVADRPRSQRRRQLILDMSRRDVQDYVINAVSSVLSSANIGYVKWDMNRNFAEAGSALLPPEQQGEVHHRYMLGLYRVLEEITSSFPEVLFESCSGGGGRFDAGILHYMPQTWTSDDTDAVERLFIQYGTSMAYPVASMGAHVSAVPNHQVGRITSLEMRGHVAMSGNFGYELDLTRLPEEEISLMKEQVAFVKKIRTLTQKGRFTRLASPFEGRFAAWQFSDETQDELLVGVFQRYATANAADTFIRLRDVDETSWYQDDQGRRWHGSALRHVGLEANFERMPDAASLVFHLKKEKL